MKNILIGILCELIGIVILFLTIKYPSKGTLSYNDSHGYIGGLGFIALGIGFWIGYFHL